MAPAKSSVIEAFQLRVSRDFFLDRPGKRLIATVQRNDDAACERIVDHRLVRLADGREFHYESRGRKEVLDRRLGGTAVVGEKRKRGARDVGGGGEGGEGADGGEDAVMEEDEDSGEGSEEAQEEEQVPEAGPSEPRRPIAGPSRANRPPTTAPARKDHSNDTCEQLAVVHMTGDSGKRMTKRLRRAAAAPLPPVAESEAEDEQPSCAAAGPSANTRSRTAARAPVGVRKGAKGKGRAVTAAADEADEDVQGITAGLGDIGVGSSKKKGGKHDEE